MGDVGQRLEVDSLRERIPVMEERLQAIRKDWREWRHDPWYAMMLEEEGKTQARHLQEAKDRLAMLEAN